jgi:hypothetical protein
MGGKDKASGNVPNIDLSQYFATDKRGFLIMTPQQALSCLGWERYTKRGEVAPNWQETLKKAKAMGWVSEDVRFPPSCYGFKSEFFQKFREGGGG